MSLIRRLRREQERKAMRAVLPSRPILQNKERPSIALCLPLEDMAYGAWITEALIPLCGELTARDHIVTSLGAFIDTARRVCVEQALQTDAEYLLWIDSDNVPPRDIDVIGRLLSHQKDIVGGWYRTKKNPHPCVYDLAGFNVEKDWREYRPRKDSPEDPNAPLCKCGKHHAQHVEKVDGLGFGTLLVHRRVFEAFNGKRWFSTQYGTEDLWFEYEAKQLGFDTWVDWGIHSMHLGIFSA
jgi:hypothetical protein